MIGFANFRLGRIRLKGWTRALRAMPPIRPVLSRFVEPPRHESYGTVAVFLDLYEREEG